MLYINGNRIPNNDNAKEIHNISLYIPSSHIISSTLVIKMFIVKIICKILNRKELVIYT